MYTKIKLQNGLTVLKVPIPGVKSVMVDVFVKAGSRNEEKRLSGISHFLEHVFFKGSRKYPTAQELSHALDAIGAEYNANTGKEHTQFYVKAAKKHFKFIFEILADMLQHPVFAREEIEREKGVIIEEINMYEDTPMRHVGDVLEEIMWPNHPLGRNIAGMKEVIRKITREDILDYVRTFYKPQNTIVAVSGAYNDKDITKLIHKFWGPAVLPGREKLPAWESVQTVQKTPKYKIEPKKTEQYHLAMGFHSYDHNHPDYIKQILLAAILGGGMSSRLFVEIRERNGWAYYVKADPSNYRDTGNFVIQAGVRLDAIQFVVKTIIAELVKIKNRQVEDRELNKVKEYLKGTLTLALERSESLLDWYLGQAAFRKKILRPEDAFREIDKVTASDIQRVARDIFQKSKLNLAIIGPDKPYINIAKLLDM
ncbi:MAG: pitrilysin family protein [Candidatus Doudnabacteria bacterium]|nr:pitrilysin family protein [bacterium]MDZ4243980.1 pitrilysin family protein [Candidatus Doudnabacteria bacterium]